MTVISCMTAHQQSFISISGPCNNSKYSVPTYSQIMSGIILAVCPIPRRTKIQTVRLSFIKKNSLSKVSSNWSDQKRTEKCRPAIFLLVLAITCAALYPKEQMRRQGESFVVNISVTEGTTSYKKHNGRATTQHVNQGPYFTNHVNKGHKL